MNHQRRVFLAALSIVILLTIALDRLFFGWMIFKVENHSGWDSFRWYNFEYQFRNIENIDKKKDGRKLLLVIGSSIAQYSVQKDMLERDLKRLSGESFRVEILSHASLLSTDLKHYASRIKAVRPDVILYLTNPADLDLERFIPPWEYGSEYQDIAHRDFLEIRYPMKIFYSGAFALEVPGNRSLEDTVSLIGRSLFYSIRFRNDWYDPIKFSLHPFDEPLKSYLYYQGITLREGIFREGITGSCFSFSDKKKSLYAEIRKKLLVKNFEIQFYAREKKQTKIPGRYDARVSDFYKNACKVESNYRLLSKIKPDREGWQDFPLSEINNDEEYFVMLSHVENAEGKILAAGKSSYSGKGLRLPGNFGNQEQVQYDYYVRRRGLEDVRISSLSDKEYIRDYNRRIQPPDWRKPEKQGLHQLNSLRLGKYYTDWIEFSEIYQLKEFNQFLQILEGIPIIIVNNPENPLTEDEYAGNQWYRGYQDYMKSLSLRYKKTYFYDISRVKEMIHFIDAHHLSYDGMLEYSPEYAQMVLDAK